MLDDDTAVRESTVRSNRSSASEGETGASGSGVDRSVVADGGVVASTEDDVSGRSTTVAAFSINLPSGPARVSVPGWPTTMGFSRISCLRQHRESEGLSGSAAVLLESAIRDSTSRAYDGYWRKFITFLQSYATAGRGIPAPDVAVAEFLACRLQSRRVSTVASVLPCQAAVVTTLRALGVQLSGALARTVIEAGKRLKPSAPKYVDACEVDAVLDYWGSQPRELTLNRIVDKAMSITMIAGILRSSDLARIHLPSLSVNSQRVSFSIRNPKNHRGLTQPVVLPACPQRPRICPTRIWTAYMRHVQPTSAAFVSLSGEPLSARRIAARIKAVMAEAGLDTERYQAHALRSAAVSKAVEAGVSREYTGDGRRRRYLSCSHYERSRRQGGAVAAAILATGHV